MSNTLETLTASDLLRANGGVKMKLTQYGYANDPYTDSYTRAGKGAYRDLDRDSIALTDSGLAILGLTKAQVRKNDVWLDINTGKGGGTITRRVDDRAPQKDYRADLYMPRGFDHSLPDYADVTVRR
jgi:hypothetical protein